MPVSSVSSFTSSAPPMAPACCGAGPTSPLSAFVLASKLPPTVSGQTTVTSPSATCRRSWATADVADQDHTSDATAAARAQGAVFIVTSPLADACYLTDLTGTVTEEGGEFAASPGVKSSRVLR